jgi:hypothetical protein
MDIFQGTLDGEGKGTFYFCLGSWASAGSQPEFQPMRRAVVILVKQILPMEARAVLGIAPC